MMCFVHLCADAVRMEVYAWPAECWPQHSQDPRRSGVKDLAAVKQISRHDPLSYREACLESAFGNRGHMGEYWMSVQALLRRGL